MRTKRQFLRRSRTVSVSIDVDQPPMRKLAEREGKFRPTPCELIGSAVGVCGRCDPTKPDHSQLTPKPSDSVSRISSSAGVTASPGALQPNGLTTSTLFPPPTMGAASWRSWFRTRRRWRHCWLPKLSCSQPITGRRDLRSLHSHHSIARQPAQLSHPLPPRGPPARAQLPAICNQSDASSDRSSAGTTRPNTFLLQRH